MKMTRKGGPKIIAPLALFGLLAAAPLSAQTRSETPLDRLIGGLLKKGPAWSQVDEFDVAGVKLGMSPEEARAALEAKGFKARDNDPAQPSWAALLSREIAKRRQVEANDSTVPMFTRANGEQGESIEVWYAATPQGAIVASVKFLIPTDRMERDLFERSVAEKYGAASYEDKTERIFCSRGESECKPWQVQAHPHLTADVDYHFYGVSISYGSDFRDAMTARMAAAVEAAAPKDAVATF